MSKSKAEKAASAAEKKAAKAAAKAEKAAAEAAAEKKAAKAAAKAEKAAAKAEAAAEKEKEEENKDNPLKKLHKAVKDQYTKKGRPVDPVTEAIIDALETLTK